MKRKMGLAVMCLGLAAGCAGSHAGGDADVLAADAATDEAAEAPASVVDLVDPRIGTGGLGWWAGNASVGASMPWGMVQAGPDGTIHGAAPWDHCSGYNAVDDAIVAFSHTHLHGTGVADLGAVGFMPVAGPMDASLLGGKYASPFDHATEDVHPGYYAVTLAGPGVRVELTATDVAAHHRYSWADPATSGRMTVIVDAGHTLMTGVVLDGGVEVRTATREVRAWSRSTGDFTTGTAGLKLYVDARFDQDPAAWGTFAGTTLSPSVATASGAKSGAWFEFDVPAGGSVEVQAGVSWVDMDGAAGNLAHDLPAWDFEGTRQAASDAWDRALSVVSFEGGDDALRTKVATALYHAFLMPNRFSDADGRYLGFDGQVHTADGFVMHTNFSLWDTYRNLDTLLDLVAQGRQRDLVRSLVAMGQQLGGIPKWPLANVETNCMIGTSADVVISEAYLKGVVDFDTDAAWDLLKKTATTTMPAGSPVSGREGVADYLALGYVPSDHWNQSVSLTLEFGVDDWALANLAAALGKTDDEAAFRARSQDYRNLWHGSDPAFFHPRNADGSFVDLASDQTEGAGAYTEGTPVQYTWLVPQDPEGLRELLGGQSQMLAALSDFFGQGKAYQDTLAGATHDTLWWMTNSPTEYWQGNEPDIHAAWMFDYCGRPDLAAQWTRWIEDTLYTTATSGLPGNDDCGTMSAWLVFATLGFYPQAGGDLYWIGAPRFPHAELALAGGVKLVIDAPAVSDANPYVQGVTLNGTALAQPWFHHSDIASGGTLHFDMGPQPGTWGTSP